MSRYPSSLIKLLQLLIFIYILCVSVMSFQRTACTPPASRIATDPAGLTARRVIARRAAPRRVLREREREGEERKRRIERYRERKRENSEQ